MKALQSQTYNVVVKGVSTGSYTLSVTAVTPDGSVQPTAQIQGQVMPGSLKSFALTVSPISGIAPTLSLIAGDVNGDGKVDCTDVAIVKTAFGRQINQSGFDPRADINGDGIIDIRDLSFVAQHLPAGTTCP